jgi:peptide-methionine (S)-S-oxide reductase
MAASTERAILAGGCFWGMQQLVRRLPGVVSTRVGYSGGDVKDATYHKARHARGSDRDYVRSEPDELP